MRAPTRSLAGHDFWLVGSLQLLRTVDGLLDQYSFQLVPGVQTSPHASGPFCYMGLPAAPNAEGVFAIFLGEELQYIGECENLAGQFGSQGYGQIHPNLFHLESQSTNCMINAGVLAAAMKGQEAEVWFFPSSNRVKLRDKLISDRSPSWNAQETEAMGGAQEPEAPSGNVPQEAEPPSAKTPPETDPGPAPGKRTAPEANAPTRKPSRKDPPKATDAKAKASPKKTPLKAPSKATEPKAESPPKQPSREAPPKATEPKAEAPPKKASRKTPPKATEPEAEAPPKKASRKADRKPADPKAETPSKKDFEKAILGLLEEAQRRGKNSVQIQAGDLLKRVGGEESDYQGMRECCSAMRGLMVLRDEFVVEPSGGDGPRLKIEYRLPRPSEGEGQMY